MNELKEYQKQLIQSVRETETSTMRLPEGVGKTYIFASGKKDPMPLEHGARRFISEEKFK